MARNGDWIPRGQEAFVSWSQQFMSGVSDFRDVLGLSAEDSSAMLTAQDAFISKWTDIIAKERSPSVTAAKKALIDERIATLRHFFNSKIRYNAQLTPEIAGALGAPWPNRHPTRIVVGTQQVVFSLEPKGICQLEMKCRNKDTGEKKIIYGMSGITAIYTVSDSPLTDITALTESAMITKSTYHFHFSPTQRGKWFNVTVCWQTHTGERGDFAAVQSAVIP